METVWFFENEETQEWMTDPILMVTEDLTRWTNDALKAWSFSTKEDAEIHHQNLFGKDFKKYPINYTEHEIVQ